MTATAEWPPEVPGRHPSERPEVLAELRGKYSQWERKMLTPISLDTSEAGKL